MEAAATGGEGLTGGVVSIPLSSIIFSDLSTLELRFRLKHMKNDDCVTAEMIHWQGSIIPHIHLQEENVRFHISATEEC